MPNYIVTYANSTGRVQTMITVAPRTAGDLGSGVICCWEVSDDGLTVTKYEEPERLFATMSLYDGRLSVSDHAKTWTFEASRDWYELIDGNYIRLTDKQVAELRYANEQSK